MSFLIRLFVLVFLAGTATGCGWLHAKQIAKRTNPKYRSAAIPGPTRVLPIFACPRARRGVTPSEADRRRLATTVVPALWHAAGGPGEPALGDEPTPVFCQEFYEGEIVWHSGAEIDLQQDAAAVATELFEGFPRERVTIAP